MLVCTQTAQKHVQYEALVEYIVDWKLKKHLHYKSLLYKYIFIFIFEVLLQSWVIILYVLRSIFFIIYHIA